jgi:hypothetical protein
VCRRIRVGRVWVWVRAAGGGRDRGGTGSSEAGNR